jgi:hypothetical protein
MTDVERLVDKMREKYKHDFDDDMDGVLRIVLKAIERGEVVQHIFNGTKLWEILGYELKPSFKDFLGESKC